MHSVMKETPVLLKDLLKSRRLELNLTQRDVARAMHMSSIDYIGMVESGIRRLDIERLPAISQVLRLSLITLTEMTIREVYGKPDTQWFCDLFYNVELNIARKISVLDAESQKTVSLMVDLIYNQQKAKISPIAAVDLHRRAS